mmetsp:Transcript_62402/g.165580  ORF Transcript_62402/g.165580 Transcript_62402/m.165580 type:complete len:277 (+) Transcript_62402:100-930(+)
MQPLILDTSSHAPSFLAKPVHAQLVKQQTTNGKLIVVPLREPVHELAVDRSIPIQGACQLARDRPVAVGIAQQIHGPHNSLVEGGCVVHGPKGHCQAVQAVGSEVPCGHRVAVVTGSACLERASNVQGTRFPVPAPLSVVHWGRRDEPIHLIISPPTSLCKACGLTVLLCVAIQERLRSHGLLQLKRSTHKVGEEGAGLGSDDARMRGVGGLARKVVHLSQGCAVKVDGHGREAHETSVSCILCLRFVDRRNVVHRLASGEGIQGLCDVATKTNGL